MIRADDDSPNTAASEKKKKKKIDENTIVDNGLNYFP